MSLTSISVRRLCLSAATTATLLLGAVRGADDRRAQPQAIVLRFPGPDRDAIREMLRMVHDEYLTASAPLCNVWVTGRFSCTNKIWTPMATADLPSPDWEAFELVCKNGRRRLEHHFVDPDGPRKGSLLTSYRLFDTTAFYLLTPGYLAIFPADKPEERWLNLALDYELFESPYDGEKGWTPLPMFCERYLARIGDPVQVRSYFCERNRQLRCRKQKELWIIQDVDKDAPDDLQDGIRYTTVIDTAKGFRVVEWRQEIGRPGGQYFVRAVSKVKQRQIAPGLFYPEQAELVSEKRGEVTDKEGRSGIVRRQLEVASVKFGDFAYDARAFTFEALPVAIGTPVTNYRKDPPTQYKFRESSLSESVINEGLVRRHGRAAHWSVRRILVGCNLVCGVFLCAYMLVRFRRKALSLPDRVRSESREE